MPIPKPTFWEALQFWFKLGWISFGGPAGQIAIMHQYLVEQKKWISESRFLHALNYCMLLPGPEAQQLTIYIGWLLHGNRGGLVAGVLFVLPSVLILLALSILYVSFGTIPWVYGLFTGLKPAIVAIIVLALIKIGKKSLHTLWHWTVAVLSFVSIFFFHISFPYIILSTLVIAILVQRFFPFALGHSADSQQLQAISDENDYFINQHTQPVNTGFSLKRTIVQLALFVCLWIVPVGLFYGLTSNFSFWKQLTLFFTQAAFITFGGAYAVLPYVAQVSVEKLHWLSQIEMIDGLALGETTPGPLIMILSFVGFMAGYHQFGGSLAMASLGLLTTTYYTFLPCFAFIFMGAPIIERTRDKWQIRQLLSLVSAAVVGVILNLSIYLAKAIVIPTTSFQNFNYWAFAWILISLIALYRFKVNMIGWIGISALIGLIGVLLKT